MNNVTITQNAWHQQMAAVEKLGNLMTDTQLGAVKEDEIVESYADARDALMRSPAPDFDAAQGKLLRLNEHGVDGLFVNADADAVISNVARLSLI